MSTAAQEVKVLEGRLAAAREKAEKESRTDTLATRLATAEQAIADGERKLNIAQQKIRDLQSAIPEAERASRSGDVSIDARESARIRYFELQNENENLGIELGSLQQSLDAAHGVVAKIRAEIVARPVFAKAAKEQRELCERAVEIARRVWGGPIEDAVALNRTLEAISQEEQNVVARWRPKLEAEGLPPLRARLHSQIGNLVPVVFLTTDFRALRKDVESAAANVLRED